MLSPPPPGGGARWEAGRGRPGRPGHGAWLGCILGGSNGEIHILGCEREADARSECFCRSPAPPGGGGGETLIPEPASLGYWP